MKTLFFILVMIGFFDAPIAWGADCSTHKIYCKIISLRPDIDKKWAMKFSDIIYAKSKKYGLDPIRSVSIAMQESSLRQINRKQSVLVETETCDDLGECTIQYETVTGYSDLSIWQFHIDTLKAFDMDPEQVQSSLDYATDFHFKLLKQKIRVCSDLGDDAWTCYHSKTEKHRIKYKEMVNRFYYKDKPKEESQ